MIHTCENSGWLGRERGFSKTNTGVFWDTGVDADGCVFRTGSMSIGSSSFRPDWSSGGREVSMGSSAPATRTTVQIYEQAPKI